MNLKGAPPHEELKEEPSLSEDLKELIASSRITDWLISSSESGIVARHSTGAVFEGTIAEFKECRQG